MLDSLATIVSHPFLTGHDRRRACAHNLSGTTALRSARLSSLSSLSSLST
jgi:hypothetical protein